eukprot:gene17314-biopygen2544
MECERDAIVLKAEKGPRDANQASAMCWKGRSCGCCRVDTAAGKDSIPCPSPHRSPDRRAESPLGNCPLLRPLRSVADLAACWQGERFRRDVRLVDPPVGPCRAGERRVLPRHVAKAVNALGARTLGSTRVQGHLLLTHTPARPLVKNRRSIRLWLRNQLDASHWIGNDWGASGCQWVGNYGDASGFPSFIGGIIPKGGRPFLTRAMRDRRRRVRVRQRGHHRAVYPKAVRLWARVRHVDGDSCLRAAPNARDTRRDEGRPPDNDVYGRRPQHGLEDLPGSGYGGRSMGARAWDAVFACRSVYTAASATSPRAAPGASTAQPSPGQARAAAIKETQGMQDKQKATQTQFK